MPHAPRAALPVCLLVLGLGLGLGPACDRPVDEDAPPTQSAIKHLVVIVQENHTFDSYFGRYCQAAPGSNPTCTSGRACCEAAPALDPAAGTPPVTLDDVENATFGPDHSRRCEIDQINGGRMDRFVTSQICGSPRNFAVAPEEIAGPYWGLADEGALADRYFQPEVGASSANDMHLARAAHVFEDNEVIPDAIGASCATLGGRRAEYRDQTVADLLGGAGVPWAFYIDGYQAMLTAQQAGQCPEPPEDCDLGLRIYPCVYDASDIPFQYYPSFRDRPEFMRDLADLRRDLDERRLPPVSFVKALGYKSEHPSLGIKISAGTALVTALVEELRASRYGDSTLILLAYDEGGGYFDHVPPPPDSAVDGQPYGTRIPLIAVGPFARRGAVSHVQLEHASIVRFIEWNWLGGRTGQLGTRDATASNLGSLLDPARTGIPVPEER